LQTAKSMVEIFRFCFLFFSKSLTLTLALFANHQQLASEYKIKNYWHRLHCMGYYVLCSMWNL